MESIKYVLSENFRNWYRTYSIAKYNILSDTRDSKLGILWNIINPLIQISTYWFVFGMGIRGGKPVDGVEFFNWMIVGMLVWFFISPCITNGVKCIHSKTNVITKMKFPISILPTTVVVKELFNHLFMFVIVYIILLIKGVKPNIYNFELIYYVFCAVAFTISLNMVTSVLNMFTRDVKKMVSASMRILMYLTPILWTMDKLPYPIQVLMKCNPLYYIVEGYRDSLFFYNGIAANLRGAIFFWIVVLSLFTIGSILIYKFKHKFIDLI